jgi:hypothetical protein
MTVSLFGHQRLNCFFLFQKKKEEEECAYLTFLRPWRQKLAMPQLQLHPMAISTMKRMRFHAPSSMYLGTVR